MIERGKYLGERVGPPVLEAEHFIECPSCGGVIDMRDLAVVWDHAGPLPHQLRIRDNERN